MGEAANMPFHSATVHVYPSCYRVDTLVEDQAGGVSPGGAVEMPEIVNLQKEKLASDGAYLFEDGTKAMLFLNKGCKAEVLHELVGLDSLAAVNGSTQIAKENTEDAMSLNGRFHSVLMGICRL